MYQGGLDFLQELASRNAGLYGLAVVFVMAAASLALHTLYTLAFRLAARLLRRA